MSQPQASNCPPDEALASYLDRTLDPAGRAALEVHAVECDDCRAVLTSAAEALATYQPPARGKRFNRLAVLAPAAAAALVLLVLRPGGAPEVDEPVIRVPAVAAGGESLPRFAALQPEDEALVRIDDLSFAWQQLAAGTLYRLTVSDERGGVVWSARTERRSLRPPPETAASLRPGQIYFWRVEALSPDLRSTTTSVRGFRIRQP